MINKKVKIMQKLLFSPLLAGMIANVFFPSTINAQAQDNLIKTYGAEKLLNHSSNKDKEGNAPAHYFALQCTSDVYRNNPKKIAEMISALGTGQFNPFMENDNKRTPRDEALLLGCSDMADMLLKYEEAYIRYYQAEMELSGANQE